MKYKIGIVNYLNTLPLLQGLQSHPIKNTIDIQELNPADCADWMAKGRLDIALVPVAFLADHPDIYRFSKFGIGCNGSVRSVCLVSNVPVDQIDYIYLDSHSRTSVALLNVLLDEFWQVNIPQKQVEISSCKPGKREGLLVIGDKAFEMSRNYKYVYDLGEIWFQYKKAPFIFACWVSHSILDENFVKLFDEAQRLGIQNIDTLIESLNKSYPEFELDQYYKQNIVYNINDEMLHSMDYLLKTLHPGVISG